MIRNFLTDFVISPSNNSGTVISPSNNSNTVALWRGGVDQCQGVLWGPAEVCGVMERGREAQRIKDNTQMYDEEKVMRR
ncbi:hypothetical protein E2C01_041376 [Portunus trituberculatus]|uniref:Uncharacterized protein n=1 Tax=Portunus trituberculatus TaxID=210409 RepID=A0A5B7FQ96_PORTR|nr:hypothetical protein [Portunus trituberculatus]